MHTIRIYEKGDEDALIYESAEPEYNFNKGKNRFRNVVVKLEREDGAPPLGGVRVYFTDKKRDGEVDPPNPPRGFFEDIAYEGFSLWGDSPAQRLTLNRELYLRFPDENQHCIEMHLDRQMAPPQDAEVIIEC